MGLEQYIKPEHQILNVGCGSSRLSEEMYKEGFQHITNVDISPTVIKQLHERYKEESATMKFQVMDVRKLEFNAGTFDVVIDKGTLDCILCGEGSKASSDLMLREVYKVLSPSGIYICISYGVPTFREPILMKSEWNWTLTVEKVAKITLPPSKEKTDPNDPKNFHYIYILQKQGAPLPDPSESPEAKLPAQEENKDDKEEV
eukprot:TRINITY_DN4233_c0_g1_i4.p1 TRINITY_DN4233_c0_g1~~TRINITY_DN4233_c0_g1_i4.p1  ORF type:complete len:202 (-),score=33.87 TRINITY_DN4233_c0_g1_i4:121-726(-)